MGGQFTAQSNYRELKFATPKESVNRIASAGKVIVSDNKNKIICFGVFVILNPLWKMKDLIRKEAQQKEILHSPLTSSE